MSILLSRPADSAGNQRRVVWGGTPLASPNTDEGAGYVTLVSSATGLPIDTITDSSDGKVSILVESRNYVWDSGGLIWVKQSGTASGIPSEDVTDRAGRLLGVIYGSQGQQLKQTATNFNAQVELATGATLYDARQIRALATTDSINVGQWIGSAAPTIAQKTMANSLPIVIASDQSSVAVTASQGASSSTNAWFIRSADQSQTGTAAAGTGVTLTLGAPGASLFQYLVGLEVTRTNTVAAAAAVTAVVTTTNLPNTPSFTLTVPAAIGSEWRYLVFAPNPWKATTANTAVTIVAPVVSNTIWRLNAWWYNAA